MPFFITPSRSRIQPQFFRRLNRHGLGATCTFFFYKVNGRWYDAVSGITTTSDGSTFQVGQTPYNYPATYGAFATGTNAIFPDVREHNMLGAMSLAAGFRITTLSDYTQIIQKGSATSAQNCPFTLRVGSSATNSTLYLLRANATSYRHGNTATNRLTAGNDCFFAVSAPATIESDVLFAWADGANGAFISSSYEMTGTPTGAATTLNETTYLGKRADDAAKLNGGIYYVAGFSTQLPDAALREIRGNPWQLLQPITRRVFSIPAAAGANQTVTVPVADVTWTGVAPTVNRTQSVTIPVVDIAWAGVAPVITQTAHQTVTVPTANVTWAGVAPTVNRTQSITIPAANVTWAGVAPAVTQAANQTITVPAANVTWAGVAPSLAQTAHQVISVPAANVDWAGVAPTVSVSGIVLPPAVLAEMYGGGAMYPRRKKKGKKEEETIEVMVKAVAEEPKGKEKIVALLPKKVREELPDDVWEVSINKLVAEVKEASDRVQNGVERLYEKRRQKDDDEVFMLLNL